MRSVYQIFGTFVYDWPRLIRALAARDGWILMRNRNDRISVSPDWAGVRCDWVHARPLHLCNVFPVTAKWLLRRALQAHPIHQKDFPDHVDDNQVCRNGQPVAEGFPEVSFLIGHRGTARLSLLLAILRSIAAQQNVSFECIVVEQDSKPLARDKLPSWIRYVHAPHPKSGELYNRSRAFNDAAKCSKGDILILHDNDILMPADYGSEAVRLSHLGYNVLQLKRYVFYLTEPASKETLEKGLISVPESEQVIENLCGGGSIVISAKAYFDLGGMDEEFIGWGGEDAELWDRCLTSNVWGYAHLPFVHLWHVSQPRKREFDNPTIQLLSEKLKKASLERIDELKQNWKKVDYKQRNGRYL